MAYRIAQAVVRGELDNTVRGVVLGRIWLLGREEPLELELAGDCWRDLAGCRCTFVNPSPVADLPDGLFTEQRGDVGDITASRKVRVPEGPVDEWIRQRRMGLNPPEHAGNALYLEWYSERNGRVVIESSEFRIEVSLPEWRMSREEEEAQHVRNEGAMGRFLQRLTEAMGPRQAVEVPEDRDMDEYEWERFLKESDARTEKYGELLEKYGDQPDGERMINRAMGWDQPSDSGGYGDDGFEIPDDMDEYTEPTLDPAREGIDWVRTESGYISHPLQVRCSNLGFRMHTDARDASEDIARDDDVCRMKFYVQSAGTKMAGALGGVCDNSYYDPGFVVAKLKRALALLNTALEALGDVERRALLPQQCPEYRQELFAIRDQLLRLMDEFRRKING